MFALGTLCVLLPLVAALETCDQSKAAALLAKGQLQGNLLDNFGDKKFWFVASEAGGAGNHHSTAVTFGSVKDNAVTGNFVYKNANGETTQESSSTYTVEGDHILTSSNAVYFFQCSKNLIAGYRCQPDGTTGASGTEYFVWAALDKTEADVAGELDSCLGQITSVEASATFVRRYHP